MNENKVVVTGIGLTTPLGLGREKTWNNLINNKSGIKKDPFHNGLLCAKIHDFHVPDQLRLLSMSFLAAAEAIKDSEIDFSAINRQKFGCTVSTSKPNLNSSTFENIIFSEAYMPNTTGRQLYNIFNLKGESQNISAACATGAASIITGYNWIKHGICDFVLAGAVESSFHPLYIAGFKQMGVLASEISAPFSKNREGFAIGEGAGILVLEKKDTAMLRGAKIYGEISGCCMSNDTYSSTAFNPNGESIASAIKNALNQTGLDKIDYINAHGTGTRINDLIETKAIKKAFGKNLNKIAISSTKAATGHLLGASGAVEIAFSLLSLKEGRIPPTLNLTTPDTECGELDYVPNLSRYSYINSAMSLSFGFGGQIGIVIVTK